MFAVAFVKAAIAFSNISGNRQRSAIELVDEVVVSLGKFIGVIGDFFC